LCTGAGHVSLAPRNQEVAGVTIGYVDNIATIAEAIDAVV
jgi:hypothetical protein